MARPGTPHKVVGSTYIGYGRNVLRERKRAVRREQAAAARELRAIRKREWGCYWTWPWGHAYASPASPGRPACRGCGKSLPFLHF